MFVREERERRGWGKCCEAIDGEQCGEVSWEVESEMRCQTIRSDSENVERRRFRARRSGWSHTIYAQRGKARIQGDAGTGVGSPFRAQRVVGGCIVRNVRGVSRRGWMRVQSRTTACRDECTNDETGLMAQAVEGEGGASAGERRE